MRKQESNLPTPEGIYVEIMMLNQNISTTVTPSPLTQQSQTRTEKLGASQRVQQARDDQQQAVQKKRAAQNEELQAKKRVEAARSEEMKAQANVQKALVDQQQAARKSIDVIV